MGAPTYIHLRVHSAYSLLEGAIKLPDLIPLTVKNKMPAVAVTDTGNLFGALEFTLIAQAAGVQPIIGCQVQVRSPTEYTVRASDTETLYDTLVLLVQNEQGYKNLLKMVSKSFLESSDAATPHILFEDLARHNEGLIALSGGMEGLVGRLLRAKGAEKAQAAAEDLAALFPNRFYMEVTRLGFRPEKEIEAGVVALALKLNIPLVATNPVFFAGPDMFEAHDALMCVAEGTYVGVEERRRLTAEHYFKSEAEMTRLFSDIPEALENTVVIAKRCAYMPSVADPMLPPFPCESGRTEDDELGAKARAGLEDRLQKSVFMPEDDEKKRQQISEKYAARLVHELSVIEKMGYAGYFLIVADFIQWSKGQNIPVGPGRGSGAGSLVAWSLTITDVDPIRFNLLFERFLNPERVSMPDFDIDFCQERRDEVIKYVQKRYGRDKVAQIITFGKLQARAVLRDVGRVLQMPYGQVDRICKMIPNNPAAPCTLQEAINQEAELRREARQDPAVDRLLSMGLKLEGLYRHASTHAAGIIIGDRPLDELIPLYRDPKSDMQVTQFNMKDVEKVGLVKFDFLGLKTLTVIDKAAEMVRNSGHTDFYIDQISLEDKATFDLLKRVETSGVFQLESTGMRDVLRQLKPDRFEEIIALVALYRPGPMDDIPRYLACKHGEEEVEYMHPMLKDILFETFGVMVYQEQVMQIAQVMSGYSLGDADLLRRAMGKKIKSEMTAQRKRFVDGAIKNGVKEKLASKIFDQIAKFAGYGFNKSHSAPYGLLAYQTAYLKANFPLAFMAATMTYDMGNTDKLDYYRQELYNMKVALLPPDINCSNVVFAIEGDKVRYGLAAIKNVGEQAMHDVVQEREKAGPFKNIWDFVSRITSRALNKRQLEQLIWAGAFDSLHNNRHQLFQSLDKILSFASSVHNIRNSQQNSLFGESALSAPPGGLADVPDLQGGARMQREYDAIGFYLTAHPLEEFQSLLAERKVISSAELANSVGKTVSVAGVIADVQERVSKKGKRFAFVRLSDQVGSYEVMIFSELLAVTKELAESGAPALASVSVQKTPEKGFRLLMQRLEKLEDKAAHQKKILRIQVSENIDFSGLKGMVDSWDKGNVSIKVVVPYGREFVVSLLQGTYQYSPDLPNTVMGVKGVKSAAYED